MCWVKASNNRSIPTCPLFPAVMLDIVQQASFRIDSFGDDRRWCKQLRAVQLRMTWTHKPFHYDPFINRFKMQIIYVDLRKKQNKKQLTWVCTSSPVTIFPTALNAAATTLCWLYLLIKKKKHYTHILFQLILNLLQPTTYREQLLF